MPPKKRTHPPANRKRVNASFPSPPPNSQHSQGSLQDVRPPRQAAAIQEPNQNVPPQPAAYPDPNAYNDFVDEPEGAEPANQAVGHEQPLGTTHSNPSVGRRPSEVFMGGCSHGSGVGEDVPMSSAVGQDIRTPIRPAGDTFDPAAAHKLIGQRCIPTCFQPGWTTIETIPEWAVDRWFEEFKLIVKRGSSIGLNVTLSLYDFFHGHMLIATGSGRLGILFHAKEYPQYDKTMFPFNMGYIAKKSLVRWDPIHTLEIFGIFRKKAAKVVSEGFNSMRSGKTKGPKWANPDIIKAAKEHYATSDIFKKRSLQNKENYKGLKSGNGPSKHLGGPKNSDFHLKVLENELNRQVMPHEMYRRLKVRKDGTFLEPNGKRTLEQLILAEEEVKDRHPNSPSLPEDELYDATVKAYGKQARTGRPRLYGQRAALTEGSRYSVSQSSPSVTPQFPTGSNSASALEEIVARAMTQKIQDMQAAMTVTFAKQMELMFSRFMPVGGDTCGSRDHEGGSQEADVDLSDDDISQ